MMRRATIGAGCAYCGGRRVRRRKTDGVSILCWPCRRQWGYMHMGRSEPAWSAERHEQLKREASTYANCVD